MLSLSQALKTRQVECISGPRSRTVSSAVSLLPGPSNIRLHPLVRKVGRLRHVVIQYGRYILLSSWLPADEGRAEEISASDKKGELLRSLFCLLALQFFYCSSCSVDKKLLTVNQASAECSLPLLTFHPD
jgi:hypothetical protein